MRSRVANDANDAPLAIGDLPELANLAQVAEVMGLTVPQVRGLIQDRRLEHIPIGRRLFVPKSAIPRFIAENTVQPCHDETQVLASASSKSADATTLSGHETVAAGGAARVRQIANRLKSRSQSLSTSEPAVPAPVIRLKS